MKKIAILLFLTILSGVILLPFSAAAGNVGEYYQQNIFVSGGSSNYRIPTAVVTNSGDIWAFCNDRRESVADNAKIQWISAAHGSSDGKFDESFYLLSKEGWRYIIGSAVYDSVNDNIMLFYTSSIVTDKAADEYRSSGAKEPLGTCIIESRDGGVTWTSRAVNIPNAMQNPYKQATTHGCSAGMQITEGEHKGRLIVPAKVSVADTENLSIMRNSTFSCIIYSDDYGMTWKISNLMQGGSDESTLCILPDGTIYVNSRSCFGNHKRAIAYSRDGGETLGDFGEEGGVWQPALNGIKGSVICFENKEKKGEYITLYSCLLTSTTQRKNLCIWISRDNGKTWGEIVTIDAGYASYSEMKYIEKTGKICIIYERGDAGPFTDGIRAVTFDVDWLEENKTEYKPIRENLTPESAVPFLPKEGLIAHLSPEGLSGYSDGDAVTEWNGSNGVKATVPSGYEAPVVVSEKLNGYSVLKFEKDGTKQLEIKGLETSEKHSTWAVVFRSSGNTETNQNILVNPNVNMMSFYIDSGRRLFCMSVDAAANVWINSVAASDNKYHIAIVEWDGEKGEMIQFIDGSIEDANYAVGEELVQRRTVKTDSLKVGERFYGEIAEIVVYDRMLTDSEAASAGLYLAEKYGLSWSGVTPAAGGETSSDSVSYSDDSEDSGSDSGNDKGFPVVPVIAAAAAVIVIAVVCTVIIKKK